MSIYECLDQKGTGTFRQTVVRKNPIKGGDLVENVKIFKSQHRVSSHANNKRLYFIDEHLPNPDETI